MKYLTSELYVECFFGSTYEESEDKFVIGFLNNEGTKLKDVVTGQIVEGSGFGPITALKSFKNYGNNMALGYMTGLRASDASVRQHVLAKVVDSALSGDVVTTSQLLRIKNIINKEVVATHKKEIKKEERTKNKQKILQKYSIEESEKDF